MDRDFGDERARIVPASGDPKAGRRRRWPSGRLGRKVRRFTHRRWVGVRRWDEGTVKILIWVFGVPFLWFATIRGETAWDWWLPIVTVIEISGLALLWNESSVPKASENEDQAPRA